MLTADTPARDGLHYPQVEKLALPPLGSTESPVWSAADHALWFVEQSPCRLWRWYEQQGQAQSWPLPCEPGSLALLDDGAILLALSDGLFRFDPQTADLTTILSIGKREHGRRLNDGKGAPDGAFVFGSVDLVTPEGQMPDGALYRLCPDGHLQHLLTGLRASNGLAWTSRGDLMFHSDSIAARLSIHAYPPEPNAAPSALKTLRIDAKAGRPDGGACDLAGKYWSAGVSAGCLNVFDSDLTLVARHALPCVRPSMPCFGGADMQDLFITSLTDTHGGGGVYRLRVPVAGVRVTPCTLSVADIRRGDGLADMVDGSCSTGVESATAQLLSTVRKGASQ